VQKKSRKMRRIRVRMSSKDWLSLWDLQLSLEQMG
jgi:hypothetical protein